MSRRIEIELTSARDDGTWTWRAAGALKPRGTLDGTLLYGGAKAGDVVRAEADFEIEGITIISVVPPKPKRSEPERLELIGPSRPPTPDVTTSLVSRAGRGPGDRRRDDRGGPGGHGPRPGEHGPRPGEHGPRPGEHGPRPDATRGRRPDGGPGNDRGGDRRSRPDRPGERRGDRSDIREDRGPGGRRPPTGDQAGADDRPARGGQTGGAGGRERSTRSEAGPGRGAADRPARSGADRPGRPSAEEPSPRGKRLSPASVHRHAVLESLPPEHRPIAEQVLRGGIPAVRTALHLERERAAAEGRPEPNVSALLAIAEEMLPRLKSAEWRDRAEAARAMVDDLSLRDLRSVVVGADAARDDDSRQLAADLREALDRRVAAAREEWSAEVGGHVRENRLVRALRLSARPPDPGARLPAEIAEPLAAAAGQAMAPDTLPERWGVLLEAVVASPVRRTVTPTGLPAEPGEALLHSARQASGRVPALAAMLGVTIPPPPGPLRPPGRPPRPPARPARPAPAPPADDTEPPADDTEPPADDTEPPADDLPPAGPPAADAEAAAPGPVGNEPAPQAGGTAAE